MDDRLQSHGNRLLFEIGYHRQSGTIGGRVLSKIGYCLHLVIVGDQVLLEISYFGDWLLSEISY